MDKDKPAIPRLILSLLPYASYDEQLDADQTMTEFVKVAYRMFLRLEAEAEASQGRDKSEKGDTVDKNNSREV